MQQKAAAQRMPPKFSFGTTVPTPSYHAPPGARHIPTPYQYTGQGRPHPHGYHGQIPVPSPHLFMTYHPRQAPTASTPHNWDQYCYTGQGVPPRAQPSPATPATLPSQPYRLANSSAMPQQGPSLDMGMVNSLTKGEIRIELDDIQHSKLAPQAAAARRAILKRRLAELELE